MTWSWNKCRATLNLMITEKQEFNKIKKTHFCNTKMVAFHFMKKIGLLAVANPARQLGHAMQI